MANNKVQLANGTVLIDITDTTAIASDVAVGKYFYNASGVKTAGTASTGGSAVIVRETNQDGGEIVHVYSDNTIELAQTTAVASDVASGKKFYNSSGTLTTGSLVVQHYYTGSGTPSSSLGVDGDIYLKTGV